MIDVKVKGMESLVRDLKKLPFKIRKNILTAGVRASAKVILDEAKRNAPRDELILLNSLKIVKHRTTKEEPNIISYSILPESKEFHKLQAAQGIEKRTLVSKITGRSYSTHYNYGGLVELGSSKMAAHPYLRPAFESKGEEAIGVVKNYMRKRLPKEIAKL